MRAKPDGILGLFLLYLVPGYFGHFSEGPPEYNPLSVEVLACAFIALRVVWERIRRPDTYRSKFPKMLFTFWVLAFIPVLIGFYLGYQTKNPNWTRGLRWLMIAGSYFYGYILAKQWPSGKSIIFLPMMLSFVGIMLVIMKFGLFWSHHGFLFLGLGGAFSLYFIRNRAPINKIIGAIFLYLLISSVVTSTITTMGVVLLSFLFAYFGAKKCPTLKETRIVKTIGNVSMVAVIAFSFGISILGFNPYLEPLLMYGSYSAQAETFSQRVAIKTLADRLPFWHPALKDILSGPHIIVPSGKPLLLDTPGLPAEWELGAHNVVLESLRLNGLFAGLVILLIYFLALKNNLVVLTESNDPVLKSLAAAILGVGIVGMTTGDFPADMTVGFWIWSLAGLGHGLFLQASLLSKDHPQELSQHSRGISPDLKICREA